MSGYIFISNSTKPKKDEENNRELVKLSEVSRPCLKTALKMEFKVFFGVNRARPEELNCELPVSLYDSHTYRSIFALKDNYIAFKNLADLVKNNDIEVIHCNTPVGGLIGRLVGRIYNVKKVIYTAHGFHFFKGAPFLYNTIIKFAERIMARWTDAIITMNEEDYNAAKNFKLKNNGKVYKVHGVGIDLKKYKNILIDKNIYRQKLGFKTNDILCFSAGDLVARKNYSIAIKAISECNNENIHYLICGTGSDYKKLRELAKELKVFDRIHFLGYRTDIKELLFSSDIFLFSTLQEGLPRSLMEAMAVGLPCVVSNIRGNIDLIENGKGGYLCDVKDSQSFANAIDKLSINSELRAIMGNYNKERIKEFDISVVEKEIEKIYTEVLGESSENE